MKRLLVALAALLAPAVACAYPDRPITLISPYALSANATIRALGDAMGRALGQSMKVVVRDGGSGVFGMQMLAVSMPDGHTLAYTAVTPLVVQPHLLRGIGYTGAGKPVPRRAGAGGGGAAATAALRLARAEFGAADRGGADPRGRGRGL